ncbi:hypothetical protein ES754_03920 [Psychrobacter frigidicola]|uniref:EpsG family protein n=1 Tax=Psychrobacter frigidicola TaxID=45611 RepID=A0A5C7A3W1_9GAMM|nr:hypothetical protein [Psychrobacter frigidicola]TXD98101.1 hypothetical protein ES754_03920 [Psychrobacter frigidicola]
MSDPSWIYNYGFVGTRLFELPSLFMCLLLIIIIGYKFQVPRNYQIVLALHCFLPLVLNDVLFKASYMPDQLKYWLTVNNIRSGEMGFFEALNDSGNVLQASALLASIPFPTPVSVISLGFYNTFLYIILFFILYVKKIFTNVSVWFYLLFPSAALYTALSLRETLIFFFMTLTIVYARESKIIRSVLCIIPIYLIKVQNFYILGPIVLLYFIFNVAKKGMGLTKALVIVAIGLAALLVSAPIAIPIVNDARVSMFVEDGGNPKDISLITGAGDFVFQGLTSAFYFLSKPLPWEASSPLQLIQSVENLFVLAILFSITRQAWIKRPDKLAFWLLFMALGMSVYGLVVANYGTAVRYRYAFVVIYVLFVCADCNIQKLFLKKNVVLKE